MGERRPAVATLAKRGSLAIGATYVAVARLDR